MTEQEKEIDLAVQEAIEKERCRCADIVYQMRCGNIDDIRTVIYWIEGGEVYDGVKG